MDSFQNCAARCTRPGGASGLQVRKATLDTFVRRLEDSTGFSFIYGEKVQLRQPVTLDVRQKTIEEILQYAFGQEAITFKISGTHILLGERPVSRKYTVSGYITIPYRQKR